MSKNSQRQLRDQFIDFTQSNSQIAERFLRNANYDLEVAINDYLSYQSTSNKKDNKNLSKIFDSYRDEGSEDIGIDGTIRYLADLGFQPEDKVVLALAEFLKSPSAGVFHRNSFILQWQLVRAESLEDMKKYMQLLSQKLDNDFDYFKKVYDFTFKFLLEEGQRTLALETAIDYWTLLLFPVYGEIINDWIEFLNREWKQSISKDSWTMFLVFLDEYKEDKQFSTYDETAAWPSLIDSFVEYFKENKLPK